MTVRITELTARHIGLEFVNRTGTFPFIYTRATRRLSRCLCIHGSHFRGGTDKLCYHASLTLRFLVDECEQKVTP